MFNPERTASHLVGWLRERAREAGAEGSVLGISGGVDSAVVAALCRRAFGRRALNLILPCESDPQDREDAEILSRTLDLDTRVVDLERPFLALLDLVEEDVSGSDLARANLKARLRMTCVYLHANALNRLVVGTGNKVELSLGYFTKYGDGASDVLPLGNLVKGQVYDLARCLGVPERIIERPPSAGLWKGQTDEQEMGVTYQDLDAYFQGEAVDPAVQDRIRTMAAASRHKRQLPPVAF